MIIKNINVSDLEKALEVTNKKYNNNIIWQRAPEAMGRRYRFTLRVKSSKEAGARRGTDQKRRKLINACWHVHGDMFEAIFKIAPGAVITTGGKKITADAGNWEDRNIGSIMSPCYYSDACECNN